LLRYSDGVTEASDAAGDEFGEERLARLLRKSHASAARELVHEIIYSVSAFSGASAMGDDITVVALRSV
jgi:phosphoserine phosphatase RsbU/P